MRQLNGFCVHMQTFSKSQNCRKVWIHLGAPSHWCHLQIDWGSMRVSPDLRCILYNTYLTWGPNRHSRYSILVLNKEQNVLVLTWDIYHVIWVSRSESLLFFLFFFCCFNTCARKYMHWIYSGKFSFFMILCMQKCLIEIEFHKVCTKHSLTSPEKSHIFPICVCRLLRKHWAKKK